ncbi:hypothetical protein MSAN_00525700 [Mycena sanguinolenta]|uniref:Uncharacterized protein n=1 Tax=Mycena sanguinolenta TaxID=230812 RepID=A0A8H6Z919_9AGAR|nr:hypothetical protein MSAN_00525700 [Mycena sanguinolenta]
MPGRFAWRFRRGPSGMRGLVTPSTAMYAIEGGKTLAEALENVSLPFVSSFVSVGIKVLEACQEASAIEENVENLQQRVYNVMLVLVNSTASPIANDETYHERRGRIEKFQYVLAGILTDLWKIKPQRKWLLVFFRDLNRDRIDRCVGRLAIALENFQIASQLRVETSQLRVEDILAKMRAEHSTFRPQLDRIEDGLRQFTQPLNAPHARKDTPSPHHIFYGRDGPKPLLRVDAAIPYVLDREALHL